MYLNSEVKKTIFTENGKNANDTGSPESQVALFTHRIQHLTEHLKVFKNDHATERALVMLVGKRRSLLAYLKKRDIDRYREIIKKLNIRK